MSGETELEPEAIAAWKEHILEAFIDFLRECSDVQILRGTESSIEIWRRADECRRTG